MSDTAKRAPAPNKVLRKKLSETVAEELEQMIRRGDYLEGESLPSERELMELFGVGRPSVREALSALGRRGLLKLSNGERARVSRPDAQQIIAELSGMSRDFLSHREGLQQFEQLRLFFESSLVRHAAAEASEQQLAELAALLELNRLAIDRPEQFKRTDIEFHRMIAEIPGNPIFLAIHRALVDWLMAERPWLNDASDANQLSYEHHAELYDCIRRRDVEGADRALHRHLQHVEALYQPSGASE